MTRSLYFLFVLGVFTACRTTGLEVSLSPKAGSSKVPVNAVARVRYLGNQKIRKADLNLKNFRLSLCSSGVESNSGEGSATQGGTAQAGAPADPNSPPKPANAQSSNSAATEGAPVNSKLVVRDYRVVREFKADGHKENLMGTEVLVVPVDELLQEDSDYCFSAEQIHDEAGNLVQGGNITFHTEKSASMAFADNANPEVVSPAGQQPLGAKDLVVVKFDQPVLGRALLASQLCHVSTASSSAALTSNTVDHSCADQSGTSQDYEIVALESFTEENGLALALHDLFGFRGAFPFAAGGSYVLRISLQVEGSDPAQSKDVPFTISSDANAQPSDLNEILAPLERKDVSLIKISASLGNSSNVASHP